MNILTLLHVELNMFKKNIFIVLEKLVLTQSPILRFILISSYFIWAVFQYVSGP